MREMGPFLLGMVSFVQKEDVLCSIFAIAAIERIFLNIIGRGDQ